MLLPGNHGKILKQINSELLYFLCFEGRPFKCIIKFLYETKRECIDNDNMYRMLWKFSNWTVILSTCIISLNLKENSPHIDKAEFYLYQWYIKYSTHEGLISMLAQIISRTLSKTAMETTKCILLKQIKPENLYGLAKNAVLMLKSLLSLGIISEVRVVQSFTCAIYLCSEDHTKESISFYKQVVAIAQFSNTIFPTFPRMLQNIL